MDELLRDEARRLVDLADNDPHRALEACDGLVSSRDGIVARRALHARSVALRALHRVDEALASVSEALDGPGTAWSDEDRGLALLTRASLRLLTGDDTGCRADLVDASDLLSGEHRVDLEVQRGAIDHKLGYYAAARDAYRRALSLTATYDRPRERARVLSNFGLLAIHLGDYGEAEQHLTEAIQLFGELDHVDGVLFAGHNLGYLHMCRGALPAALREYDKVAARAREIDLEIGILTVDQAAALLASGLFEDALRVARRASVLLQESGELVERSDALVTATHAALALGNGVVALRLADEACAAAVLVERPAWTAVAELTRALAQLDHADASADRLEPVVTEVIERLRSAGLSTFFCDALFIGTRIAIRAGDLELAQARCAELGSMARHRSPSLRARWHLARALVDEASARHTRARRHAEVALGWSLRFASGMGSIETRFSSSHLAVAAARAAVRSTTTTRALPVLRRLDALLDATFALPRLQPSDDTELADRCSLLRTARVALDEAARTVGDPEALARAAQVVADAEQSINARVRTLEVEGQRMSPLRGTDVFERAAASVDLLVCGVEGDDRLVSAVDGVWTLHHLQNADRLHNAAEVLGRRLAHDAAGGGRLSTASAELARRIDEMLIPDAMRASAASDRPLVVVPGTRFRLPFLGLLPSLRNRVFVTAPSFGAFVDAHSQPGPERTEAPLFVAGPGLAHAQHEIDTCSRHYAGPKLVSTVESEADVVKRSLGPGLAHFACHVRIRDDNPLFSELVLADGSLAAHELQTLHRVPRTMVLAGCSTAVEARRTGRTSIGLPGSLLILGARTVVASQVDIEDSSAAAVMDRFHADFAAGVSAATALRSERVRNPNDVAGACFAVVGADSTIT